MNNELKKILDDFIKEFENLPVVKQYVLLKAKMKEDNEFLKLKDSLKNSQKDLALSIGTEQYKDKKTNYQLLLEEYNNHPYVINYKVYEQEIRHLLKEIESCLK